MARPTALDDAAVAAVMAAPDAPNWEVAGGKLLRSIECPSFAAAIDLVAAVAGLAEEADHHPDIDIRWRTVTLALVTHDAGGITELDIDLARAVDRLVG